MYRQGDVLLVPITETTTAKEVSEENGRLILAYGETTGHAHAIMSKRAKLYLDEERMLLHVNGRMPVNLTHEEHSDLLIPAGRYMVVKQKEYDNGFTIHVTD